MFVSDHDLINMPLDELLMLGEAVQRTIDSKKSEMKSNLLKEFREKARACNISFDEFQGLTFEDVMNNKVKKEPAPAKYRNPDNYDDVWSGFGRKPKWIIEYLQQGKHLDDLLIH
jgi:DNA-binding protein H-NS